MHLGQKGLWVWAKQVAMSLLQEVSLVVVLSNKEHSHPKTKQNFLWMLQFLLCRFYFCHRRRKGKNANDKHVLILLFGKISTAISSFFSSIYQIIARTWFISTQLFLTCVFLCVCVCTCFCTEWGPTFQLTKWGHFPTFKFCCTLLVRFRCLELSFG